MPGGQRLWQDMVLGVDADALGGIASVRFFGDCFSTTINAPSIYTYTDPTGAEQKLQGYFIILKASLFTGVTGGAVGSGSVRIFAETTARDGTMQKRVIGNSEIRNEGVYYKADWPMELYPRLAESDFDKTIGVGGNYPDLVSFITAARSVSAETPKGTFITNNGFYEEVNITGTAGTVNARGRMILTHGPGVKVTHGRALPFNAEDDNANAWNVGWPGVEFRGSGLVRDQKNVRGFVCEAPCWFNGNRITNSLGWPACLYYWNGGPHPPVGVENAGGFTLPGWHTDTIYEFVGNQMAFSLLTRGLKVRQVLGSPFTGNAFIIGTFCKDVSSAIITDNHDTMTIHYTGAGAATTTMDSNNNFVMKENGVPVKTINPGSHPSQGNVTIAQLCATINSRQNWTATPTATILGAKYIVPYTDLDVRSATQTLQVSSPIHTEWYQGNYGNGTRENLIHRSNVTTENTWGSEIYNGGNTHQDLIVKYNAWGCARGASYDLGGISAFGPVTSHGVAIGNFIDGGWGFYANSNVTDSYCAFELNVMDFVDLTNGGIPTTTPIVRDNAFTISSGGLAPATIGNRVNNFKIGPGIPSEGLDADFQTWVVNKTTGDFRPSPSGQAVVALNKRTPLDTFDGRGNLWNQAGDAIGPWAIGYSSPTYFDFTL